MNPFKRALHSRLPRSDAFRRALRLNTAIVAVIVLCLGILSVQLRAMMKKNVEDNCCLTLEYGLTQLSAQLQSVTSCVIDFRELLAEQSPNGLRFSDAVSLNAARTALRRIVISNPLVGEIAYVCEDSGLVITTQSIFYNIDSFLSTYEFAGMDISIFCDYLGEERLATVRFLPCDALDSRYPISFDTAFCCAIPLDTERYSTSKGVAFVFLRLDTLTDIVMSASVQPYAFFELYDNRIGRGDTLLFQGGVSNDEPGFETELINESGTLRADVSVSNRYIDQQMRSVTHFISAMVILTILAGAGTAFWTAHRQSLPMRRVIASLRERNLLTSDNPNEYDELISSVDTLIGEKELDSRRLNDYQESLLRNILDRLFSNALINPDDEELLRMHMERFPGEFAVYCGRVFVSSADSNDSMQMTLLMLLDYLKAAMPPEAILYSTDTVEFGLIYPCSGRLDEAERTLQATINAASARFSAQVQLVRGGVCESIGQIGSAFDRAKNSRPESFERGGSCIMDAQPALAGESCWRLKRLQGFYHLLISGDADQAVEEIRTLFSASSDELPIDPRERYTLLRTYILMAQAEICDHKASITIAPFSPLSSAHAQLVALEAAAYSVCQRAAARQGETLDERSQAFIAYIDERYADPDLCASSLASEFHVSEKYLFSLFRKKTGLSPTGYLHHVRMQKAAELLCTTDDTVQAISTSVGFANFGTFYKAFKREYGVAPGKYRQ